MAQDHKELQTVLHANGLFTKNFYQLLAKDTGNVFFSPISIHSCLSMLSQGAAGSTKDALTKALNVPDVKTAADGYSEVLRRLNNVDDVELLMANKVYLMQGHELKKDYDDVVRKSFHSEVQLVDFKKNAEAAGTINSWVEQKTKNKIKDLISADDLNDLTRLVLVNAIYFKGNWLHQFDAHNTRSEPFYLNANDSVNVQMMHITKRFGFKDDENLDAKILELPYKNKALSMIIILPNKRDGIADLEKKLAGVDLTKITESMYQVEVVVSLPKFKIEQTIDLRDPLEKLGLGEIFEDRANFSDLITSDEPLKVSKAIQKAFIEVNEEGAEAAAATGVQIKSRSGAMFRPPLEFKADHGFVFVLGNNVKNVKQKMKRRKRRNILPIFIGKLVQPIK